MRKLPNLSALRAFDAAARNESFKKAAEELHVTHAAVSRQIINLEEELNVQLFKRLHQKVVLTDAGQYYMGVIASVLSQIEHATANIRRPDYGSRLILNVEPGFAGGWLLWHLQEFQARHPQIDFEIISTPELTAFPNTSVDAGIYWAAKPHTPGEDWQHIVDLYMFPVCHPGLPALRPSMRAQDLRGQTLIHWQSTRHWRELLAELHIEDVDTDKGIIFHDPLMVLDAAAEGRGVAIGDNILASGYLANGSLVAPFETQRVYGGSYYWLSSSERLRNPNLLLFRDWLLAACRALDMPQPP